tara:strand:- start:28 stop:1083 length:1056 start_codon:yes stop_codon:yes gene_type:complete
MAYTTINKSTDHFNTTIYTGSGSARTITTGLQSDFVWLKNRSATGHHYLFDQVRGVQKPIYSSSSAAEASADSTQLTAFGSTGFDIGTTTDFNANGTTAVSWTWKAGGGAGSSNTDGTINTISTSVNTTAGFSISTYAGNSTQGATIGHGLGVAPKMIILKSTTHTEDWAVAHEQMNSSNPWDYYLNLNLTGGRSQNNNRFGNVAPTSTVFTLGNSDEVNGSGKSYVVYCFAEKTGFSKFGSYVGNGNADGPFIYTGFKPGFIIWKRTDSANGWILMDTKRSPVNNVDDLVEVQSNGAEATDSSYRVDYLSNGFKIRNTNNVFNNGSGSYIYMAFASVPLVGSNDVPATAR